MVDIIYIFRYLHFVHVQTARKHAYMHITVSLVSILSTGWAIWIYHLQ